MPTEFHDSLILGLVNNHIISMTAHIHAFDKSLAVYKPRQRGCYMENERKLEFFKSYTKTHCVMECLANFTLKTCGCKKFSMPRRQDTPVCGLNQTKCFMKVLQTWVKSNEFKRSYTVLCNCLPACHRIEYEIKLINQVDYIGLNYEYHRYDQYLRPDLRTFPERLQNPRLITSTFYALQCA